VQPAGMVAVRVGGMLGEPGGLSNALGKIFREVADMAAGFFGPAEDALDVHLLAEPRHVSGLGQLLAGLLPGGQRGAGVRVDEGLGPGVPDGHPFIGIDELVMRGPPHLVIGRRRDRP
jgi:hypothetical protein